MFKRNICKAVTVTILVFSMMLLQLPAFAYKDFNDSMSNYSMGWGISNDSNSKGSVTQGDGYIRIANPLSKYYFVSKTGTQGFEAPTAPYYVDLRIEARTKIARVGTPEIEDYTANEIGIRGNGYNVRLLLYSGASSGKAVNTDAAGGRKEYSLDITQYHNYRVVVHTDYSYDLYVDGEVAWTDAPKISDNKSALFKLGASDTNACDFDVDYIKLQTGEPPASMLKGIGNKFTNAGVPETDVATILDNTIGGSDKPVKCKFTLENTTGSEKKVNIIPVLYRNGVVEQVGITELTLTGYETSIDQEISIDLPQDRTRCELKVFIWDNVEGMKPLLEVPMSLKEAETGI